MKALNIEMMNQMVWFQVELCTRESFSVFFHFVGDKKLKGNKK